MRFLKKASIKDISAQPQTKWIFRTEIDISSYYKEFELYLSHEEIVKNCGEDFYHLEESALDEKIDQIVKGLKKVLLKNGAVVSAVHVPESLFQTSGDIAAGRQVSTNYLSLCESILDHDSYQILAFCIKLADRINDEQYDNEVKTKPPVILIVHAGCVIGCTEQEEPYKCIRSNAKQANQLMESFVGKLQKIKIKTGVKIAVENVTPYYNERKTDGEEDRGKNCGWQKGEEQEWLMGLLTMMNHAINGGKKDGDKTENKEQNDVQNKEKISFGMCIDVCHIFASYLLKNCQGTAHERNEYLCNALYQYFDFFDTAEKKEAIYLFHVSQYGEKGEHGMLFCYPEDTNLVEKIQQVCYAFAPKAPITLEMADGYDKEKACKNFNETMYFFSVMRTKGEFGRLLEAEGNEELKEFFDNLFWVYASDGNDTFELSRKAWNIKEYVLKNLTQEPDEETLFGFTHDGKIENTALFRLKSYVYYTRFCNLGFFSGGEIL